MEDIWDEWYGPLASYIHCSFSLNGETEDLMQDIMLKVHGSLGRYDGKHALSTWLFTIARNTCLDWLDRRRLATESLGEEPSARQSTESIVLADEIEREVQAVLAGRDPTDRGIAWLAFYERLPYRHIAKVHGLPLSTVKMRIHRLRQDLRARLEDYHA